MGDLKEQLLKAGLVTEEQVRDADHKPKGRGTGKAGRGRRKPGSGKPAARGPAQKGPRSAEEVDLAEAYRLRAREERELREAEARARREADKRRKENRAKIATLIREHAQNRDDAEQSYHFQVSGKVKQVYVTNDQLAELASGELAITFLEGRRCLIPAAIAEQIQDLDPDKLVVRHAPTPGDAAEDDIPDDLMW